MKPVFKERIFGGKKIGNFDIYTQKQNGSKWLNHKNKYKVSRRSPWQRFTP